MLQRKIAWTSNGPHVVFATSSKRRPREFERRIERNCIERGKRLFAACLFLPPQDGLPNLDRPTIELSVLQWIVGFDKRPKYSLWPSTIPACAELEKFHARSDFTGGWIRTQLLFALGQLRRAIERHNLRITVGENGHVVHRSLT